MKTSTRHRWVMAMAVTSTVDHGVPAICRDCGLEIASYRVKGGGLGECLGKMCEQRTRLPLISGDPQNLGNLNPDIAEAYLACVGCGMAAEMMIAHRSPAGRITGWVFSCGGCLRYLGDHAVVFVAKEEPERESITDGEEGQEEGGEGRDDPPGRPGDTDTEAEGRTA